MLRGSCRFFLHPSSGALRPTPKVPRLRPSSQLNGCRGCLCCIMNRLIAFSMSFSISEVRPCAPETSRNHWHVVQQVLIQQLCDLATAWRSSCILHLAWLARSLSMQAASMNLVPGLRKALFSHAVQSKCRPEKLKSFPWNCLRPATFAVSCYLVAKL